MARKKAKNRENLLTQSIIIRVNEQLFKRLEKLQKESDCSSVAEVIRKIISRQRIKCFYRDISMNGPMEELAMIRKELKSIGININQQTRFFHTSTSAAERSFYAMKTADLYRRMESKVDRLLLIVSALAEKWLPK